jgi:hypothetical protein
MAKDRSKKPRALSEADIERITARLPEILATPLPIDLSVRNLYQREHDDHDGRRTEQLTVAIGDDGDAWISARRDSGLSLRFRMPMIGGGASPRTWNALRILALAIKLDNQHNPIP